MKTKLLLTIVLSLFWINKNTQAQGSWSARTPFGGTARYGAVGFSIGDKGYFGTGGTGNGTRDFWEYDPSSNSWTQKADFGGTRRIFAVGFSIDSLGYVGTGSYNGSDQNDFWSYSPTTNIWTQKSNLSGAVRQEAVGFSIEHKGYIGTGISGFTPLLADFNEYDPVTDSWTTKAPVPGGLRCAATGFSIGTKGYLGTGRNSTNSAYQDFYEYNPATDTWLQKADLAGGGRSSAVSFSIGNQGYIGTGYNSGIYMQDLWAFNPVTNSWASMTSYGNTIENAVGFSTCTKGYIGTGRTNFSNFNNFAQYTPNATPIAAFTATDTIICAGNNISFTDISTNAPTSWNWVFEGGTPSSSTDQNPTNIYFNISGTYTATLTASNANCLSVASRTIIVDTIPHASQEPSGAMVVVNGQSYSYSISPIVNATSYAWTVPSGWTVISGQGTTNITYTVGGAVAPVTICVTASNHCGSDSSCLTINNTTGVLWNNIVEDFSIYSTNSSIIISFNKMNEEKELEVFSIMGEIIFKNTISDGVEAINTGPGIYFVRIGDKDKSIVRKLFVE